MAENDNLNNADDALNESRWEIPNLDGIDFTRIRDTYQNAQSSSLPGSENISLTPNDELEMTQSLANLAASTSTTLAHISGEKGEQQSASADLHTSKSTDSDVSRSSEASDDPESTAAFDPLADDYDEFDALNSAPQSSLTPDTPNLAPDNAQNADISGSNNISSPMAEQTEGARADEARTEASRTELEGDPTVALTAQSESEPAKITEHIVLSQYAPSTPDESAAPAAAAPTITESNWDTDPNELTFTSQFAALSDDSTDALPAASHGKTSKDDRLTRRVLLWGIIGVIVLALVIGTTITMRNRATAENHAQLLASCISSRQNAQASSAELKQAVKDAQRDNSTSSADVEDTSTLTVMHNAVDQATASIEKEQALDACSDKLNDVKLRSIHEDANTIIDNQATYVRAIRQARTKVSESRKVKEITKAHDDLGNLRQTAQTLYDESAGKVKDESTRANLKTEIGQADSLLKQNTKSMSAAQYTSEKNKLNSAMSAVKKSVQDKEIEQEQARKKKEQEAKQVCSAYAGSYSNGSIQFTLNGDCSVSFGDNSRGAPADKCVDANGREASCVTQDDNEDPNHMAWIMQCSGGSACKEGRVDLYTTSDADSDQPYIRIGDQKYTKRE